MYDPWNRIKGGGLLEGSGVPGIGGQRRKWDKCKSIINELYLSQKEKNDIMEPEFIKQ